MTYNHESIYQVHPEVVAIYDDRGAFDAQGNKVELDQAKIDAVAHIVARKQELQRVQHQRAAAYSQEADPLAFKMLRGEATKEEWEAKIEEIRQRYPYPS